MINPVRVVIDETSFDFRGLDAASIERRLDDFNDTIWVLHKDGIAAWSPPMLDAVKCVDNYELFDYLMNEPGRVIDRDTRNRFFGLISKCPDWDESIPEILDVVIADGGPVMALSVAFALVMTLRAKGVACLVFGACPRRGFMVTSNEIGRAEIFYFADAPALMVFWRYLYELEDVSEELFFTLANRAFPSLLFNPDLSFRRFEGAYRDLRPRVVGHLSVLNDHFLLAYRAANGVPQQVEATLASAGCPGISPESPNTRKNKQAMGLRDIDYQGSVIRCEWHTKIEPHRNRIHFAFGDQFGEMIFVGIFVDHLDT